MSKMRRVTLPDWAGDSRSALTLERIGFAGRHARRWDGRFKITWQPDQRRRIHAPCRTALASH
jgi:hypothetical protein